MSTPITLKKKGGKLISFILCALLVAGLIGALGAAPRNAAHAAEGDVLTVSVPAGVTGQIYVYAKDGDYWDYVAGKSIENGKAIFRTDDNSGDDEDYDDYDNIRYAIGKTVTLAYYPDTEAGMLLYGSRQVLGGYIGSPYDTGAKFTTFKLTNPTTQTFTPVKGAKVTLKVTPAPSDTVSIDAYAHRVVKSDAGMTTLSDTGYVQSANGVYTFVLQPKTNYAFSADGQVKQGQVWFSYTTTWSGGHKGSSANTPKGIKILKTPAAGKTATAKAIALKLGTATIKGKTAAEKSISISNPFTGISNSFYPETSSYSVKIEPGFYIVSNGITKKFIAVKNKKTAKVNFTTNANPKYDAWSANISVHVAGTVKKGSKLKASVKLHNLPYKFGKAPKFKYVWTDGIKILGKKATYKVKKADVKKGKKIFVIAYGTKHGYTNYSWATVR